MLASAPALMHSGICTHGDSATKQFRGDFKETELLFVLQRQEEKVTVYMGVPTMYSYLLSKYDSASEQDQQQAR